MRIPARTTVSTAAGFTLIEVLFAMLFLTAGLLGIAAMQDIALSRNIDARRLTVATNVAAEMIERIRFNAPANSTAYVGAAIPGVPYLYHGIVACGAACPAGFVASVGNTASNPTASGDYAQWRTRFGAVDGNGVLLLPTAVGTVNSIVIAPGPGPTLQQIEIAVGVAWSAGLRTPTVTMTTIVAPL